MIYITFSTLLSILSTNPNKHFNGSIVIHMHFFAHCGGSFNSLKQALPGFGVPTLLVEVDVIWVVVGDIILLEDESKIRGRLRVRNFKIARTLTLEIFGLCGILNGEWNFKHK